MEYIASEINTEENTIKLQEKNLDIEIMRFFMILSVTILHFSEDYRGTNANCAGGYLGVDFFFVISGIFLAQHYEKHKSDKPAFAQAKDYFLHRLKRLYPPYLFSIFVLIVISFIQNEMSLKWLGAHLYETKWQFLLLHYLGVEFPSEVRSNWFLPVLMLLSYLLYFLLAYNKEFFVGVSPISAILILVHICFVYGSLCMQGAYEGWLGGGILRGFAEMSLGIYIASSNIQGGGY